MSFKVSKVPAKNVNDTGNAEVAKIVPSRNSPVVNEERSDETPDHPPEIKWPPAVAVDHKPMKLNK